MCRTIFVPSRLAVWVWRRPADSHHFVQLTSFFTAHFCTLHTSLLLCISRQTPQLQKRDWTRKTLNSVKRGPRVCQLSVSEELRSGRYYQIFLIISHIIRYCPIFSDIIWCYQILSDIIWYLRQTKNFFATICSPQIRKIWPPPMCSTHCAVHQW